MKVDCVALILGRKGSKGLPGKNRLLFEHTISKIPKIYKYIWVITNTSITRFWEKSAANK